MLKEEEIREIEAEVVKYPTREAASIDAMKIVQRHRGWISDDSLRDIADFLQVPLAELDGLATFYNLIYRRPVGRHVILLCDSVSCWVVGYERARKDLEASLDIGLGETTPDRRFTLLPIVCLGCCDRAPAMLIDNDLYGDLDTESIDRALGEYT